MQLVQIFDNSDSYKPADLIVLQDVVEERNRQDEKWGPQNHNPNSTIQATSLQA